MGTRTFAAVLFLLTGALASAATITGFTATPSPNTPFTETVNSSFIWDSADVNNTVITCQSAGGCSGAAIDFEITGTDLMYETPTSLSINGSYGPVTPPPARDRDSLLAVNALADAAPLGNMSGSVSVVANGTPSASFPFSVYPGLFDVTGTLYLNMPDGSQLVMPDSFQVTIFPPDGPEPATVLMLATGIFLIAIAQWRRRRNRATNSSAT